MSDELPLIVVNIGSLNISGGLSGDDAPTSINPILIEEDDATITKGGAKKYRNPMATGVLTQHKDFELLIRAVVGNDFDAKSQSRGIMICDTPRHTAKERALMCEVLFDVMEFPFVNFYYRPALAALAANEMMALVVEMSDNGVVVAPVLEGVMVKEKTVINNVLTGKRLTNDLLLPAITAANGGTKVASRIKVAEVGMVKRNCKVAATAEVYAALAKDPKANLPSKEDFVLNPFIKDENGKVWEELLFASEAEMSKVPEALFQPGLLLPGLPKDTPGLAEVVVQALIDSDVALAGAIVLSGRGCMFPGFGARLKHEVTKGLAAKGVPATVKVVEDDARAVGAWLGGSLLTTRLSMQDNNFVSKETWSQYGRGLLESGWLAN